MESNMLGIKNGKLFIFHKPDYIDLHYKISDEITKEFSKKRREKWRREEEEEEERKKEEQEEEERKKQEEKKLIELSTGSGWDALLVGANMEIEDELELELKRMKLAEEEKKEKEEKKEEVGEKEMNELESLEQKCRHCKMSLGFIINEIIQKKTYVIPYFHAREDQKVEPNQIKGRKIRVRRIVKMLKKGWQFENLKDLVLESSEDSKDTNAALKFTHCGTIMWEEFFYKFCEEQLEKEYHIKCLDGHVTDII